MSPHRKKTPFGITTLEDISTLILQSHDLDQTLKNIVTLVARRMRTEVCSIYLLEEDDQQKLRLRASKGLSKRAVGRVTMRIDEGLTGLAIENKRVISILEPNNHPRYRYFKETREERFHTFLGIPLFDRRDPIGVITIQTVEPRQFSPEEISALSTIAFQISSIVVNARLLDSIRCKEEETSRFARELELTRKNLRDQNQDEEKDIEHDTDYRALRGTVAYPGVASGPANLLDERLGFADILDEEGIVQEQECEKLEAALEKTRIQTLYLEKRVADRLSADDAAIFHTHLMILEDRGFLKRLTSEVREQNHSAPYALKKVVSEYIEAFERMDDIYLRERAADMEDIGRRILGNLVGQNPHALQLKNPGILVARELLPSDMASLDHNKILGIVTEAGEKNSHAVIMAKSMGIPAIVGVRKALKSIQPEEPLILDANSGTLYISPSPQISEEFQRLEQDRIREMTRLEKFRDLPARTWDGVDIALRANIGLIGDVAIARRNGAAGVGLYRTEFPYMARSDFPDRDEQYQLYRRILEGFDGAPVTIRTLDIGGDKGLPYFSSPKEDNPFMGWRSVRVSLDHRDIFQTQIEAILMAGVHGPVKLLFPMISGMNELRDCRKIVEQARDKLRREGIAFAQEVPLGVMIEVPSAVYLADRLAREVDFFALGTNDLIQYVLAADRNNPLVAKYYDPLHPAVLQILHDIGACAGRHDIDLCICGEMASDPLHMTLLLGLGFREFSMAAPFIPRVKKYLAKITLAQAQKIASNSLELEEGHLVREQIRRELLSFDIKTT